MATPIKSTIRLAKSTAGWLKFSARSTKFPAKKYAVSPIAILEMYFNSFAFSMVKD